MSRPCSRRSALLLGGSACAIVLAGCLSSAENTTSDSPSDETACPTSIATGAQSCPEKPAPLTENKVLAYVEQYEQAHIYNTLHREDATIRVSCDTALDSETNHGFYVVAGCHGSADYGDNTHGDVGPPAALYLVNGDTTVRIGRADAEERSRKHVYSSGNESQNVYPPDDDPAAKFRIYNFDTATHNLAVSITYLDSSDNEQVVSEEYEIESESSILQEDITVRRGAYQIHAESDIGATATAQWNVSHADATSWDSTSIFITPDGGVDIREPSFREVS